MGTICVLHQLTILTGCKYWCSVNVQICSAWIFSVEKVEMAGGRKRPPVVIWDLGRWKCADSRLLLLRPGPVTSSHHQRSAVAQSRALTEQHTPFSVNVQSFP